MILVHILINQRPQSVTVNVTALSFWVQELEIRPFLKMILDRGGSDEAVLRSNDVFILLGSIQSLQNQAGILAAQAE